MARDISGIDLKKVADRIGNQWMTLGVHLGIPYHTLQNMSAPAQGGPTQYGARMMNHWYEKNARLTNEQVRQAFMNALKEAGRMDLARDVQNSRMTNLAEMQLVFQKISPSLTREWRDVGIYLDMGFSELDAIKATQPLENDPRREMLETWFRNTLDNRRQKLIAALQGLNRLDIVQEIGGIAPSAPVNTDTNDYGFFGSSLPSGPTPQPAPVRPQPAAVRPQPVPGRQPLPQATNIGAQPMVRQGPRLSQTQVDSLQSHQSVEAWPARVPTTDNMQSAAFQSYRESASVETSLQHQPAPVAANRIPAQPRQDLASVETQSLNQHHSVDGRQTIVVQPTDAAESINSYHDPSMDHHY